MVDKKDLQEVLALALANGGDFADIFMEHKKSTGIACEADKIERINSGIDAGAGIRVISGDSTAYAYTNDLSKEGLTTAAKIVSHAAQGTKKDVNIDLNKLKPHIEFAVEERPDQVNVDDKVDLVLKANKVVRDYDERIKQVTVMYGDVIQNVTIANSEGTFVEDERIRSRFIVNAVAAQEGLIQTGYNAMGNIMGFELFKNTDPLEVAKDAARKATLMLEAKPAPAGKMPVVMAGEAGGTMVHEACGHGLEADLVQKKLSVYNTKGEKVAAEGITVYDDATYNKEYGTYTFDDEGTRSRKVTMIEKGVLVDYMYDKLTAMKEGIESNGHGRRESYQNKPIRRMANTIIAPGKEEPEKIIKDIKNGFLVKKMGGGQVNTTNGDFVFDVAEGYMIRDGEVAEPVRGATLTGNGPEVLKIVDRIGKDLGFTIGTCGKDGQGVPVSDAQPTMSIKELTVGGTSQVDPPNGEKRDLSSKFTKEPRIRRI